MKDTTTLLLGQGEIRLFIWRHVQGHRAFITVVIIIIINTVMILNYDLDYPWIARYEVLLPINYVNNKMRETFEVNGWKTAVKI